MAEFFHDQKRDILIYPQWTPVLQQAIPEAQQINGKYLAVPRNLHNLQVLRYLNYPVTPIITDQNYDWPIEPGKTAQPHQKMMANFHVLERRCFNLSDPGTMKTNAALWSAEWLMRQHGPGQCRCLIVGLINVLETVWMKAIFNSFLGKRSCELLYGSADKRSKLLATKPDFAIINYEGLPIGAHYEKRRFELDGLSKELLNDKDIKIIIVDEGDAYIDASSKRSRVARMIFEKRPYLWVLTGTPTAQAPDDAHGIAKLVNNAYGRSYKDVRESTMHQVSQFKWVPRKEGNAVALQLLTPAIRYDIKDVWKDAPEMLTELRMVPLTDDQTRLMADLKRDLQIQMRSGERITPANEGVARMKFLQISLGGVYDEKHKSHVIDAKPRYDDAERIVKRAKRKVLIFVPLTNIVHLLYERLSKNWRCAIINGEVNVKDRPELIRQFESEEDLKVMIVDAQSTAHGINEFVVADTVIWFAPIDKTRLYIQGNKRAHRPGQKWPVTVYQLASNKLEVEMFRRLENNQSMQGALLDLVRRGAI